MQESKNLITQLNLPDIFEKQVFTGLSKLSWKRLVNSAIRNVEESRLKEIILVKSKLKDGPMATENFEQKEYLTTMKLPESRVKFQLRSKMLDAKMNYSAQHEKELWKCDSCRSAIESQSHLLFCPAYASLREGKSLKNDEDLIEYIQNVLRIRTKLNLRK